MRVAVGHGPGFPPAYPLDCSRVESGLGSVGRRGVSIDATADADALFAALARLSRAAQALHAITERAAPQVGMPDARLIELLAAYDGIHLLLDLADFVEQASTEREDEAPDPAAAGPAGLSHLAGWRWRW